MSSPSTSFHSAAAARNRAQLEKIVVGELGSHVTYLVDKLIENGLTARNEEEVKKVIRDMLIVPAVPKQGHDLKPDRHAPAPSRFTTGKTGGRFHQ